MTIIAALSALPARCSHRALAACIFAIGSVEALVVAVAPASLPAWLPYEFSWGVFLSVAFAIAWYLRGYAYAPSDERPSQWRVASFFVGVSLIYVCMQTYVDYAAQHMFFVHRLQHLVLHHTGPFLIALSDPGPVIAAGMPQQMRRWLGGRWICRAMLWLQQPVIATVLFVGLIYLWPAPPVHFYAMLDPRLYTIMNWSVTIDGILFWALILDWRPQPVARLGYGSRVLLCLAIVPPQILLGAVLTFSTRDHFEVYAICGRIMALTGLEDQQLAGLILWIPPSMMSVTGALIVLNFLRLNDERGATPSDDRSAYGA